MVNERDPNPDDYLFFSLTRTAAQYNLRRFGPAAATADTVLAKLRNFDEADFDERMSFKVIAAMCFLADRQDRRAMSLLCEICEEAPSRHEALNLAAWELATHHDAALRDVKLAVQYAERACELTDWKEDGYLDTLAAAYAQSGDFQRAIDLTRQAIEHSSNQDNTQEYRDRLRLYEQNKPYTRSATDPVEHTVIGLS